MLGGMFTHVVALYFNRKSESFPSLVFLHHLTVPRLGDMDGGYSSSSKLTI